MAYEENKVNNGKSFDTAQDELKALQLKCEEYLNGWKRERADFLNYKKDEMERIGCMIKYANQELILKILPILDNFYLATRQNFSSENSGGQENTQIKNYCDGIDQIIKQLEDFLKKEGIESIEVLGKPFDPNTMEAVGEAEGSETGKAEGGDAGTIIEEVQRGYTLHGKLIRPAKVR